MDLPNSPLVQAYCMSLKLLVEAFRQAQRVRKKVLLSIIVLFGFEKGGAFYDSLVRYAPEVALLQVKGQLAAADTLNLLTHTFVGLPPLAQPKAVKESV